jgi:hypothetical protein
MNTALLRLIAPYRRSARSDWVWRVPGFNNPVVLHRCHTYWKVRAVTWPDRPGKTAGSEVIRGARLDWHRNVVKNELRALLKRVVEARENV